MMPRTTSSWPRQRRSASALDSGVGVPVHGCNIVLRITVSLIVFLCITTVGFFYTCGPLVEPGPGECSVSNDSTAAVTAVPMDAKFSSSESTFDLTLYYCHTAQHYMNMLQRRWSNKKILESIDTCRSPTMVEGNVGSKPDNTQHPLQKLRRFLFQRKQHAPSTITATLSSSSTTTTSSSHLTLEDFPNAFSRPDARVVTESQQALIRTLSQRVRNNIPKFISRANHVAWGGPGGPKWYYPVGSDSHHHHHGSSTTASSLHSKHVLDSMDGGRLLYSYLRILKWPRDLRMHVPVQLCGKPSKGCDVEVALSHTLEFRETFQPFHMTPAAIYENRDGFIYHRGFSPPTPTDDPNKSKDGKHHHHHQKQPKHSLIWFRPGIHKREDSFAYLRAMMYTLDNAIADSLRVSGNKMGRFNVIIDTQGFSFSMVPRLWEVKLGIQILQDHLPDRLGMVFLVNLSHPAEFALNLVRPFLNKEVRNKIRIVPHHDETKKWAILAAVIEPEYIPTWLGGTDDYRFDPDTYYPRHLRISNQQGLEFLQTMPHHAAH